MFTQIISLLALTGASTAAYLDRRNFPRNNVTVYSLDKSTNSTGGEAHTSIGGTLNPFGSIGAGCGVNWNNGAGYGGMVTTQPDNICINS